MGFLSGQNRHQIQFGFSLDESIEEKNPVRIIDAFVQAIDVVKLGFRRAKPKKEGRPGFDPRDMTALYIYGNLHKIRSSRLLEHECKVNIELMWLVKGLTPDYKTIADFRRDNAAALKNVFREFNRMIRGEGNAEFYSIDGSKFSAWNSKDNNFTLSKLDDRIERMEIQIEEYIRQLENNDTEEEVDREFTAKELEEKMAKTTERLERYKGYMNYMQENGLSQLSLTDMDSILMKTKNGFMVSHNVQAAVESDTHMIADFVVNSNANDFGMLNPTMENIRNESSPEAVLECVADKGYTSREDMMACLENGIIPNVILPEGKDSYELVTDYEEVEISAEDLQSTEPEMIKKCLHSGHIPEIYNDVLSNVRVETVTETITEIDKEQLEKSVLQYIEQAAKGYFVRDMINDLVYCPAGCILRRSSVKKDGDVWYCNKLACSKCNLRNHCTTSKKKFKTVSFSAGSQIVDCKLWPKHDITEVNDKQPVKKTTVKKKVVKFTLTPDRNKMDQRKCLSEHPFGTVKRSLDGGYFLTCGTEKVTGEIALLFLAYNFKRALSLFGFDEIMRKIKTFAADSAAFSRHFLRFLALDYAISCSRCFFPSQDRIFFLALA